MSRTVQFALIALLVVSLITGCSSPSPAVATRTITPTAKGFVPGDPTSTPLGEEITDPDFLAGKAAHAAGDYVTAIRYMKAFVADNPDSAPAHWYIGNSYFFNDCEASFQEIEKALEINPNYAMAWADRGALMSCLGDEEQSVKDLLKALSIDPSIAKAHHNLGVHYMNSSEYQQALQHFTIALDIDSERVATWVSLSEAQLHLGYFQECTQSALQALRLNREYWPAFKSDGYCNSALGDFGKAIHDYEVYLANVQEQSVAEDWYTLAGFYYLSSNYQDAVWAFTRAIDLDPNYVLAYIDRGSSYLMLSQYENAIKDETTAIEMTPIPMAYNIRGLAYYGLGQFDQAVADYQTAISLDPRFARPHYHLFTAYFEHDRFLEAIEEASQAVRLDPSYKRDQRFLDLQARAHYALGNYEAAVQYMTSALSLGEFTLGYYYRGIFYQALDQDSLALQDLIQFLEYMEGRDTTYQHEINDANARIKELTQ